MKQIKLLMLGLLLWLANAGGMAMMLNNMYLYNNTTTSQQVTISNIAESANQFTLAPQSGCRLTQPLLFLPVGDGTNQFTIMVKTAAGTNPIVIDNFGLLALASDSTMPNLASGAVKHYSLLGFCGNKLGQNKFLKVTVDNSQVSESVPPSFQLVNCKAPSNYVYFINDKYIRVKNRHKAVDFSKMSACQAVAP